MSTEQKFGLVDQQLGIIYDAIKNIQSDVNFLAGPTSNLNTVLTNGNTTDLTAVFQNTLVSPTTINTLSSAGMSSNGNISISAGTVVSITSNDGGITVNSGADALNLYGNDIFLGNAATINLTASDNINITSSPVYINGTVGIGISTPNANALLDITSTTKAFMPPRMTTTQKNAIPGPTAGMMIYDSTLARLSVYNTAWQTVAMSLALTGLSGDAIVSDGSGGIKVAITGNSNYSSGASAFISRTTGTQCTAVGVDALRANTGGNSNVAVGFQALLGNLAGFNNTAVGTLALVSSTSTNQQTSVGHHSLFNLTTGSSNVGIGHAAGKFITGGSTANSSSSQSVYLGAETKALASGGSNQIVIGYNAVGNGDNSVTLGNTSITQTILQGKVGIGTTTPTAKLDIAENTTTSGSVGVNIQKTGAVTGSNSYGIIAHTTGASNTNYAGFFTATGATNNYGLIVSAGSVGIGTTAPGQTLEVKGADGTGIRLMNAGSGDKRYDIVGSGNDFRINETGVGASLTIQAGGKVGIGTTAPGAKLHVVEPSTTSGSAGVYIQKTGIAVSSGNSYGILAETTGASTTNYGAFFSATGGITNNYGLVVSAGKTGLGTTAPDQQLHLKDTINGFVGIRLEGSNGSAPSSDYSGADFTIYASSDTPSTDTDFLGFQNNSTTGGGTIDYKMKIYKVSGNVVIGFNADQGNYKAQVKGNMYIRGSDTTSINGLYVDNSIGIGSFKVRNDGLVGFPRIGDFTTSNAPNAYIATSGSNGIYTNTSSIRYKKDIIPYNKGLDIIKQLKPVYYKSKSSVVDGDKQFAGFIAEDIHDLGLTEFVTYLEGDTAPNSVAYQNMVVLLTKAMQEQQVIIETLISSVHEQRERIAVLESKII